MAVRPASTGATAPAHTSPGLCGKGEGSVGKGLSGEGSAERFPGYGKHEIHSSFGNLLFSYGAVGLALFLLLLWRALRNAPVYIWLIMAAPLTYSTTHMGLRSTAFWFLVVFVTVMYAKRRTAGH